MPEISSPLFPDLQSFQKNMYSQCGEDGIVEEILKRIGNISPLSGWCVEFGALDGIYLSNTYNLIRHKNYKAVLIEGDRRRFKQLCHNIHQSEVIKICQFVTFEGSSTLDRILQSTPIPPDFDFLSIDIDGCDYHVFQSLKDYRPKIVCIEFNPTIPNEIEFVQAKDFSVKQGSSAKSIVQLAKAKDYSLVAATPCNLIFVSNDLREAAAGSNIPTLEELRDDSEYKTYLFFGYDGTVLSNKDGITIPWHKIELRSRHLQQLPQYLRTFAGDYSVTQKIFFLFYLLFKFPRNLSPVIRSRFPWLGRVQR